MAADDNGPPPPPPLARARPAPAAATTTTSPPPLPSQAALDWPRLRPLLAAALMCLLLALQLPRAPSTTRDVGRAAAWASAPCPAVGFAPPSLAAVAAGDALPALFGGLYQQHNGSGCLNCRRHGFWSDFCSFDPSAKPLLAKAANAYWGQQLCPRDATRAWLRDRAREAAAFSSSPSAAASYDQAGFLTMAPCDLWRHARGRTLWILGDSMSKDLYRAVLCLLVEFWPELNERDLLPAAAAGAGALGAGLPQHGEPRCAILLEGARVCFVHVIRGDLFVAETGPGEDKDGEPSPPRVARGVLPMLLGDDGENDGRRRRHRRRRHHPRELADASRDVFVLNFGLWHGLSTRGAYNRHLHEVGAWIARRSEREERAAAAAADDAANGNAAAGPSSPLLSRFLWFETPKQHFADAPAGEYPDEWIYVPTRAGPHVCAADEGVRFRWDTGALKEATGGDNRTTAPTTLGEARALFARRAAEEKFDAAMAAAASGEGDGDPAAAEGTAAAAAAKALAVALSRNATAAPLHLGALLGPMSVAEGEVGGDADDDDRAARLIAAAADALRSSTLTRADARAVAAAAAELLARRQAAADARAADLLASASFPSSPRPPLPLRPPWPSPPPPIDPRQSLALYVASGGWRNADARRVLGPTGYGLRFIAAYNASVPAFDMHRSNDRGPECSHYCMPSQPQVWLAALQRELDGGGGGVGAVAVAPAPAPTRERTGGGEIYWEKGSKAFGWPWKAGDVPGERGGEKRAAAAAARRGWGRPCGRLFCFGRK